MQIRLYPFTVWLENLPKRAILSASVFGRLKRFQTACFYRKNFEYV
ncbi:hypothetical protein NEIELOOT_02732 [Neisseria elongata subsp. glycolytica ATCC 29315]|uniref:Uncharacterized protein n=1 Tax=Neisseria elongata subsp. glycolytica ATCC 29315 TaxID=546263 RepID=D4DUH2_NEIEG|nr:hypothetical protein NEIELOOT_02732 [Neisseria elongata subsp. glycolytica ATCC 29315]